MISDLIAILVSSSPVGRVWRISWTGSADLYYVYVDGVLVGTTGETFYEILVGAGQQPVIDVLDTATATPAEVYVDGLTLAWYSAGDDVASYRIDQWIDGDWTLQATVEQAWYQTWTSPRLADDTVHTFRIVPIGVNGNEGTTRQFAALLVRRPDVPVPAFEYDAGAGTVTIA